MFRQQGRCFLLMTPQDLGSTSVRRFNGNNLQAGGMYVLGNVFLTNYYAIYDLEELRVGLVPSKETKVQVERGVGLFQVHFWNNNGVIFVVLVIIIAVGIGVYIAKRWKQEQ